MATFLFYTFLISFIFISLVMILLVLIQKGRGGGLASAFGGGAGGHTAFGSKTGDVLTWATSIVFGLFLLLAVGLNLTSKSLHDHGKIVTPAATPVAPPPAGIQNEQPLPPLSEAIHPPNTPPAVPTTAPMISPATLPATQPAQ